jgi:hypothetical protein
MMGGGRQRKPYTGFGKALKRLMVERDIRSWTQLEERIHTATGERYSHQSMSKYAAGSSAIPPEFVVAVSHTLGLEGDERSNLAEQYAFHSLPEEEARNSA